LPTSVEEYLTGKQRSSTELLQTLFVLGIRLMAKLVDAKPPNEEVESRRRQAEPLRDAAQSCNSAI
jgi:hypothetical protein